MQLSISYRHELHGDTVAWVKPDGDAGEVCRIMSAALGVRFTEATMSRGVVDAALDLLPGI